MKGEGKRRNKMVNFHNPEFEVEGVSSVLYKNLNKE